MKEKTEKNVMAFLKPVEEFETRETEWVIPNWIPKGSITLLVGDGGVGKTNLWCNLLSRISGGLPTMLDDPNVPHDISGHLGTLDRETGNIYEAKQNRECIYFSKEDSTETRLKDKLKDYGANNFEIFTVGIDHLNGFNFTSPELEAIIEEHRPAICVFDPVQAFYPAGVSMSSRQQSRQVVDHLVRLGQQYGTAFLLVCHTIKRKTADWREKIAGTGDLPDIARSVIFTSYTEIMPRHKMRFISNEKNSYAKPQETVLYTVNDDGMIEFAGTSEKQFADFVCSEPYSEAGKKLTQKELCKQAILEALESNGKMAMPVLDDLLKKAGFCQKTCNSAKNELIEAGVAVRTKIGSNSWFMALAEETEAVAGTAS